MVIRRKSTISIGDMAVLQRGARSGISAIDVTSIPAATLAFSALSSTDQSWADWKKTPPQILSTLSFSGRTCTPAWMHARTAVECNKATGVDRAKYCMPLCPAFAQVYENVTFGGVEHLRIADEEGMFERTVTVCSASKLFSLTGGQGVFAAVIGPM